jgi:hypothetical protein
MVISLFANEKVAKDSFNLVLLAIAYSDVFLCLHMYIDVMLCLLLQILFTAALCINTSDITSVSSVNSLQSQYAKLRIFWKGFMYGGGAPNVHFAPAVSLQRPALLIAKCAVSQRHTGPPHALRPNR